MDLPTCFYKQKLLSCFFFLPQTGLEFLWALRLQEQSLLQTFKAFIHVNCKHWYKTRVAAASSLTEIQRTPVLTESRTEAEPGGAGKGAGSQRKASHHSFRHWAHDPAWRELAPVASFSQSVNISVSFFSSKNWPRTTEAWNETGSQRRDGRPDLDGGTGEWHQQEPYQSLAPPASSPACLRYPTAPSQVCLP